ncbi:Type II secretion system protein F [Sterolibacterium denitrificans]|uniref:General secretion pathway protein F n=1 Tax=Sterolibacterium denitrificans TaxID=157592 RepID=A0A7Z7HQT5_9PROT|nr:type II secretion system inner membrane protein GspF [Sterolibacterium denitrificans]SMB25931.1 Type II secretion system protein F [Sterolibacterium denitrificans]
MAAFNYQALDASGRQVDGVLEADTSRAARSQLRERQLFPISVTPVAGAGRNAGAATSAPLRLARRAISAGSLSLLTRQWAILLEAGLTVEQSLTALIEQNGQNEHEHGAAGIRQTLAGVRAEVLAGHTLHAALAQHAESFPPIYRAVVNAGEKSGELARLLLRLADHLEAWQATRQKVLQALLYPALVSAIALLVIVGLLTYVVPQIVEVFKQGKQTLPLLTRALILISDFLRSHFYWLLPVLIAASLGTRRLLQRDDRLQLRWHRRLLELPLLGRHLRTLDSARLASTLAIMVGSGVPLLTALETARDVLANRVLRAALDQAIRLVREGNPLHRALGAEKLFPPLLIHMIASGEASGTLAHMLERAAVQQQAELDRRTAVALGLFEPLLILFMGGIVLLIVLAVLLPIIEINMLLQ